MNIIYKYASSKLFNMILMIDWIIPTQSHVIISSHLSLVNCGKWFFYSTFIECSISIMIITIVVAISDDKHKSKKKEKKERRWRWWIGIKKWWSEKERGYWKNGGERSIKRRWLRKQGICRWCDDDGGRFERWRKDEDVICWCSDEMTVMMKKEM